MNIKRIENEKQLSEQFQNDQLTCYSLAPGAAKNSHSFLKSADCSFMSSVGVKKEINELFGKSACFVNGKVKKANFFAFSFKEKTIICTCESGDIGTGWYWNSSNEQGSRYGKPMLISWDKEVKDFWPQFCEQLKELIDNKPVISNTNKIKSNLKIK